MAEPVRHRQTKEAATDMFDLQPPRHIPTLPRLCEKSVVQVACRISVSISSMRKPVALATTVGRRQYARSAQAEVVPEHDPGRASTERPSPDLGRRRGVSGVALQTGG